MSASRNLLFLVWRSLQQMSKAQKKMKEQSNALVELWIHTWGEDGKRVDGTGKANVRCVWFNQLARRARRGMKREAKGISAKYVFDERKRWLSSFKKSNLSGVELRRAGSWRRRKCVSFDVPRLSGEKDAAYLIFGKRQNRKVSYVADYSLFTAEASRDEEEAQASPDLWEI